MTPDQLLAEWRATFKEMFPRNDADVMPYRDSTLALGVLLSRKLDRIVKTRVIEPAHAAGVEPRITARPQSRKKRGPV